MHRGDVLCRRRLRVWLKAAGVKIAIVVAIFPVAGPQGVVGQAFAGPGGGGDHGARCPRALRHDRGAAPRGTPLASFSPCARDRRLQRRGGSGPSAGPVRVEPQLPPHRTAACQGTHCRAVQGRAGARIRPPEQGPWPDVELDLPPAPALGPPDGRARGDREPRRVPVPALPALVRTVFQRLFISLSRAPTSSRPTRPRRGSRPGAPPPRR